MLILATKDKIILNVQHPIANSVKKCMLCHQNDQHAHTGKSRRNIISLIFALIIHLLISPHKSRSANSRRSNQFLVISTLLQLTILSLIMHLFPAHTIVLLVMHFFSSQQNHFSSYSSPQSFFFNYALFSQGAKPLSPIFLGIPSN